MPRFLAQFDDVTVHAVDEMFSQDPTEFGKFFVATPIGFFDHDLVRIPLANTIEEAQKLAVAYLKLDELCQADGHLN